MPIPVFEVLEGLANTIDGQPHELRDGSGTIMDIPAMLRDCASALRRDYLLKCLRRDATHLSGENLERLLDLAETLAKK